MRKRRKFRGTWLPVRGQEYPVDSNQSTTALTFDLDLSPGEVTTAVFPVLYDSPQEPEQLSETAAGLNDIVGNEYVLRRIVGKFFCSYSGGIEWDPEQEIPGPRAAICTAGFFVARAGDVASDVNSPIGGSSLWQRDYNPLDINCIREPWIWRRSWMLGNPAWLWRTYQLANSELGGGWGVWGDTYTVNNSQYGSVADGPHIDAKTVRRVGQDDRLWIAISAHAVPLQQDSWTGANSVRCTWDIRAFGALRKARNRGNF